MSLPREQKKAQTPWLDLAIFAGVLAFLGYSLHAFLSIRVPPKLVAAVIEPAVPPPPAATRSPASQSSPGSTEILRVPCLHDGPRSFTSTAHLLQIHSAFCGGDEKSADWRASNQTSGEQILVFVNRKEKTVSTNYFSLKDGKNELVFVEELGHGKSKQETILVTRSAP